MSEFVPSPGEQLRLARLRLGVSQEQLARRLGVDRRSIGWWEAGRIGPDFTEKALRALQEMKEKRA